MGKRDSADLRISSSVSDWFEDPDAPRNDQPLRDRILQSLNLATNASLDNWQLCCAGQHRNMSDIDCA
jgi:hypothetical protein